MHLRNLDRTRIELLRLITDCSDEVTNKRIHPEKWTISQVLEHLYLVERGMALAIRQGLKSEDHPTSMKPLDSLLDRDRSTKITAPTHVIPNPEYQTIKKRKGNDHAFGNLGKRVAEFVWYNIFMDWTG